ncbi:uncharacterized protein CC84DRAFT_1170235 [Paraphaeosphaeria sporulosa]|uniref:Uncharacterized protein n=1 Tax=Paraphaeosphaeria sporulosa TaxID=1460663 RepID=A0A177CW96_9PLEO|nr:uncharacterized protein CC84DRAFT_1170235 [Paraphaeosphaeria sporulosa]OAG11308.1 hypothetical protein CC84DRAFT_1170235 [Paraphaeosphaeria sporulosa]
MRRVLITARCAFLLVLYASLSRAAPLKVGPTAQTVREGLLVRAGLRNHREPGTGLNDRLSVKFPCLRWRLARFCSGGDLPETRWRPRSVQRIVWARFGSLGIRRAPIKDPWAFA